MSRRGGACAPSDSFDCVASVNSPFLDLLYSSSVFGCHACDRSLPLSAFESCACILFLHYAMNQRGPKKKLTALWYEEQLGHLSEQYSQYSTVHQCRTPLWPIYISIAGQLFSHIQTAEIVGCVREQSLLRICFAEICSHVPPPFIEGLSMHEEGLVVYRASLTNTTRFLTVQAPVTLFRNQTWT